MPRSVGLGPVFSPTQGRLGHRPVGRQPLPVDPGQPVVGQQPQAPELVEHAGLDPFGEAPVGRGLRADPGGAQRAPLAAGAQDEEDPVQGRPIRDARVVAAQRMARPGRQQRSHPLPQRVRNPPTTVLDHLAHRSPPLPHGFQTATVRPANPPYRDRLLVDALQRDCRVIIAGPTTLVALLNSLRMGFRTLAIQKRSSEAWRVLSAVKTEFNKYGDVLDKVQKKLQEATSHIDQVSVRRRAIDRKLRGVETLPEIEATTLLDIASELVAEEV